jgi:hypothetical protein
MTFPGMILERFKPVPRTGRFFSAVYVRQCAVMAREMNFFV